ITLCLCLLRFLSSLSVTLLHSFFFFNHPPTTEIYTLSLHDALPIWWVSCLGCLRRRSRSRATLSTTGCASSSRPTAPHPSSASPDRKSTRLNSSHDQISYAVFCLKKKKKKQRDQICPQQTKVYNKPH